MMTCVAEVAGGGPADEKRLADTGLQADDIMSRSFSDLESACASDRANTSEGLRSYARYYIHTHRVGLALPHAEKALALAEDGSYEKMAALGLLADVYDAMGWFEQRDDTRWNAVTTGRAYFQFDPSKVVDPLDTRVRIAEKIEQSQRRFGRSQGFIALDRERLWMVVLEAALQDLSWSSASNRLERMHGVWADLAFSCNGECQLVRDQYPRAVIRFARAGDVAFAQSLYDAAIAVAAQHVRPEAMMNFDAAAAVLAAAKGQLDAAADKREAWIGKVESTRLGSTDPATAEDYAEVGLAEEAAGRLDKAIEHFEKSVQLSEGDRSSFDVASRLRFLRGRTIRAYWGLVRGYAGRYLATQAAADFDKLLRTTSMLNARQFGEQLGIEGASDALTAEALHLRGDELLLLVVQTDKALVSMGLTKDWKGAHVSTGDPTELSTRIRKVKVAISRPGGAESVRADLTAIGAAVLQGFRDRLAKAKTLTVISDGLIAGLPFALLPESDTGGAPLVSSHAVVYTPSLPFLASQRAGVAPTFGAETLALGDPKYGSVPAPLKDPLARAQLDRAVTSMRLVVPLPETREEAKSVFNILGGRGTILLGEDATETKLKGLPLGNFGFIHLATHGVLGNQLPGLGEPALLLAAEAGQDAFLTMSEVSTFKLRAKLTVLSACDTGSGQYFEGEGVMGLSRAFLLAGSRGVLATLWPIASESTVDFMKRFYGRVGKGESPASALRATQVEFIGLSGTSGKAQRGLSLDASQPASTATGFSDPYYWAPFVLLGGG